MPADGSRLGRAGCGLRLAVLEDFEFWLPVTIATRIQYRPFRVHCFPFLFLLFFLPYLYVLICVFPLLFSSYFLLSLCFYILLPSGLSLCLTLFLSLSLPLSFSLSLPPHPHSFSPLSGLKGEEERKKKEREAGSWTEMEGRAGEKQGETGESL